MGDKNRDIAEYYKKRRQGEQDDELLDRIVRGGKRERAAKAEERLIKRAYRNKKVWDGSTYTVHPGDSWFSIAERELGDMRYAGDLARANPGFDVINPGVVLHLPSIAEETPVITNEDFGHLLSIQQDLIELGADPSGARITDFAEDAETLEKYFPDEAERARAERVLEAFKRGEVEDTRQRPFASILEEEDEEKEKPFDILAHKEETLGAYFDQYLTKEEQEALRVQAERLAEDIVASGYFVQDDFQGDDVPQVQDDTDGRGVRDRTGDSKIKEKAELEVVETQEIEPTEAAPVEVLSYAELVTAEETNWGQWQSAFDDAGIDWQDSEGNLDIETVSTFIADDIEANKERYAQELGMAVDELAEVSSGRVVGWLEAVETHKRQDHFSVRTLLQQTDQEIFGFSIDVRIGTGEESNVVSIEDYARTFEGRTEEVKETANNIGAASTMIAFALFRVAVENEMDIGNTPQEVFQAVFGNLRFRFTDDPAVYGGEPGSTCFSNGAGFNCTTNFVTNIATQLAGHEFGHILRGRIDLSYLIPVPTDVLGLEKEAIDKINTENASLFVPYNNLADSELAYLDENNQRNTLPFREDTEGEIWQWHTAEDYGAESANSTNEIYGEMFLAWAFDEFADNEVGDQFYNWMEDMMPVWMRHASEPYNEVWHEE